VTYRFSLLT